MTPQRVTLITLGVADPSSARAFYEAYGWRPAMVAPEVAFYRLNGAALGLYDRAHLAADQGRDASALGTGAMTLAQNFAEIADVDAAFAAALAAGAAALAAPAMTPRGGYCGLYADPDGHVWELAMNPFWPLSQDGSLTLPDTPEADAPEPDTPRPETPPPDAADPDSADPDAP
ncbi:MAG: putative glyoxalase superfamily protein PhnB [Paracoccaceae bacterium]|jgi:uncharacterized glyoxalase superfamily protein PhnB